MDLQADKVVVRQYRISDDADWRRMRKSLWPDSDDADADDWLLRKDAVTCIAEDSSSGALLGFAEVGQRVYADGCETSPVAFLEGWYVQEAARRKHVGARLVLGAKAWAQAQGLHELASDSLLDNVDSIRT